MTRDELEEEVIREAAGILAEARVMVIRLEELLRKLNLAFPPNPKHKEDTTK